MNLFRPPFTARAALLALGLAAAPLASAWDYAFVAFPEEYTRDFSSDILVDDEYLPVVRSQDRLGFCYAFQAAYVLENHRCLRGSLDCRDDRPENRLSTLGLSLHEHEEVGLFMQEGGDGMESVRRAVREAERGEGLPTEACVPYYQLTESQTREPLEELLESLHLRNLAQGMREMYLLLQGTDPVAEIEDEIGSAYPSIRTWAGLHGAEVPELGDEGLLHPQVAAARLLVPEDCDTPAPLPALETTAGVSLPGEEDPDTPWEDYYDDVMRVITQVLASDRVVGINVCMAEIEGQVATPEECPDYMHAITVTGYSRFCNEEGCADALRILNSWGTDWQDEYGGGWVYAPALIDKLPLNRHTETLFFLTDSEAEAPADAAP